MSGRVIVLGYDSATFDLVKPWAEAGELPNMARLLTAGAHGLLRSTVPPISAQAWTSFATGVNAGQHGIYDFYHHDPVRGGIYFTNASHRRRPAIWQILSERQRTVGIINMPLTYPGDPVNGFMLSGMSTPGLQFGDFTYPKRLKQQLRAAIGDYWIEPPAGLATQQYVENLRNVVAQRIAAARYLDEQYRPALFVLVFMVLDRLQHTFWRDMAPDHPAYSSASAARFRNVILDAYKQLDVYLGEVLDARTPEDTIIVMSDHGAGPQSNYVIHLNRLLAEWGYLTPANTKDRTQKLASSSSVKMQALLAATRLRMYLRRMLPETLRSRIAGSGLFRRFRAYSEGALFLSGIDWAHTTAYSDEDRPNIWINLKGRNPQGIVAPGAEYEQVRSNLIEKLSRLKHPHTDETLVSAVHRREELYSGAYLEAAPDLIIQFREEPLSYITKPGALAQGEGWMSPLPFNSKNMHRPPLSGNHRINGILVMCGPTIKPGTIVRDARIVDLVPTMLYLLDEPIPSYVDGKVLISAFHEEHVKAHPPKYTEAEPSMQQLAREYTEAEAEVVRERLRGLGYIE